MPGDFWCRSTAALSFWTLTWWLCCSHLDLERVGKLTPNNKVQQLFPQILSVNLPEKQFAPQDGFHLPNYGGAFSLLECETCTFTEGGLRCSWRCVRLWNPPSIMSPPVSKRLVCQKSSIEKSDIWKSCVHPQVRLVTHLLGMDPAARSPPQPLELSKARLPLPAGTLENFHQEKMLKEWSIVESKWETWGKFWLNPEPWWIFCKAGGELRHILAFFEVDRDGLGRLEVQRKTKGWGIALEKPG